MDGRVLNEVDNPLQYSTRLCRSTAKSVCRDLQGEQETAKCYDSSPANGIPSDIH